MKFSKSTLTALRWIIDIFKKHNVTYQITGGLAAKIYGATRLLVDIDIDIPNDCVKTILNDIKPYLIYGPTRYQDEQWDILLLTLDYNGQLIDISGADDSLVYDLTQKLWVKCEVNFSTSIQKKIDDMSVMVIARDELIKYKLALKRDVDLLDITLMNKHG